MTHSSLHDLVPKIGTFVSLDRHHYCSVLSVIKVGMTLEHPKKIKDVFRIRAFPWPKALV